MGNIVSTVGHLHIDLSHVQLSGNAQRTLLQAVQATVVTHLAQAASHVKVVTISLSQNNGAERPEEAPAPPPPAPPPPAPPR